MIKPLISIVNFDNTGFKGWTVLEKDSEKPTFTHVCDAVRLTDSEDSS
jgi:hypothetical protein